MNEKQDDRRVRKTKKALRLRGLVLILFLAAAVLCGIMTFQVRTNYDMIDYLPDEAPREECVFILIPVLDCFLALYLKRHLDVHLVVQPVDVLHSRQRFDPYYLTTK